MASRDVRDPFWAPVPFEGPALPGPIKVAVTKESYGYPIHPDIVAGIDRAAGYLRSAGYQVEEVETPSIKPAVDAWLDAVTLELKETLDPLARQHGSKTIQDIFDAYLPLIRYEALTMGGKPDLGSYDWILFTSPQGVRSFGQAGLEPSLGGGALCVVDI